MFTEDISIEWVEDQRDYNFDTDHYSFWIMSIIITTIP